MQMNAISDSKQYTYEVAGEETLLNSVFQYLLAFSHFFIQDTWK